MVAWVQTCRTHDASQPAERPLLRRSQQARIFMNGLLRQSDADKETFCQVILPLIELRRAIGPASTL
jgi:hypothetical protein